MPFFHPPYVCKRLSVGFARQADVRPFAAKISVLFPINVRQFADWYVIHTFSIWSIYAKGKVQELDT